ncbi:MAG: GNAT family N-acetyltransferase [Rhodobacteraceae bacterium]|nr:GNAT family N-acetyltransferase [Paracoccaceae bacterium]
MTDTVGDLPLSSNPKIRRALLDDLGQVVDLDARTSGKAKQDYWQDIFKRYGSRRVAERFFLIAEQPEDAAILGLIVGEVREWEFGSEQCGWIFAVSVDPDKRQQRVGEGLFRAICDRFRQAGVSRIRTMARRDNPLHMSFFRGEGMAAGPFIQLELNLDDE